MIKKDCFEQRIMESYFDKTRNENVELEMNSRPS